MTDISEALGRRVGPLPVAGWLAAILGGLGVSWYLRSRGQSPDAVDAEGTDGSVAYATGSPTPGLGGAAVSDPSYPGNITAPTDPDSAGDTPIGVTTNAQWRQQAVKYLVGQGVSPISAEVAIAKYLAGTSLNASEVSLVNRAIIGIGPTPVAVPSITTSGNTSTTTPATSTKPPAKPYQPKNNREWRNMAIKWLNKNYRSSLSYATSTVDKYLAHKPLTAQQVGMINAVSGRSTFGPPPSPVAIVQAHSSVAHHTAPTAAYHATTVAPTSTRDTGTNTNP